MARQPAKTLSVRVDRIVRGRIAQSLRDYRTKKSLDSAEALADDLGIPKSTLDTYIGSARSPRASTIPSGIALRHVSAKTGDSTDWLLGFDVDRPSSTTAGRSRLKREPIGTLVEQLMVHLPDLESRPEEIFFAPMPTSPDDVMSSLGEAWRMYREVWERRYWSRALVALAAMLRRDARDVKDSDRANGMRVAAATLESHAEHVRDSSEQAARMRVAGQVDSLWQAIAQANKFDGKPHEPIPLLVMREKVPGGAGFAWRDGRHDYAYWIDGETGEPMSKRSKSGQRFLVQEALKR
jgi:hypothetical protein